MADLAIGASGRDLYAKMRMAVLPSGPAVLLSTVYLSSGEQGVKDVRQLSPAAKITTTYKSAKIKFEIQFLGGNPKPLALIHDGERLWLLTAVGATELQQIPDKAQDEVVRTALLLEGDGKEPSLSGEETVNGKPAQILDLSYFGKQKIIWVDQSSFLPLRAELDRVRYEWVYDSRQAGLIRRIVGRDAKGFLKIVAYSDPPVMSAKIEDDAFDFKQTKSRVSFFEKVGDALGGKPEVMAAAGARGLDEEIKKERSAKGGEDYKAVERMETVIVTAQEVEEFLREGRLGKYAE